MSGSRSPAKPPNTPLPLILASASPRRRWLLKRNKYPFTVEVADVAEISPVYFTPGETVLRNARAKAWEVALRRREALVLGVDTIVAFGNKIFGKPADLSAAEAMLRRLNGRAHEVYSGVWLVHAATGRERGFIEVTRVQFRRRTPEQRRAYLARVGPLDKAGAYAAQEDRGEMIEFVEGSFSNVIGLPMESLGKELREYWQ